MHDPRLQSIRLELQSHLEELEAELVSDGVGSDQASVQALERFGDVEQITAACAAVGLPWSLRVFPQIFAWTMFAIGVGFSVVVAIARQQVAGSMLEHWWWFALVMGTMGLAWHLARWMLDYLGLRSFERLFLVMAVALSLAFAITLILDVNDFEVVIHAGVLGVGLYVVLGLWWRWWSRRLIAFVVTAYVAAVVWSAMNQEPLLQFFGQMRCLYVKAPADLRLADAVSLCQAVRWSDGLLVPFYLIVVLAVPLSLWLVYRFVRCSAISWYRRVIMLLVAAVCLILPMMVHNVNQRGELDVIPWKREIYGVYADILGRRPEEKDIEFYAYTRSYQRMDKVRETLYASYERRLKIGLVYQEMLGREPTATELEEHLNDRMRIVDLYAHLSE
jgi:hypothetical protein